VALARGSRWRHCKPFMYIARMVEDRTLGARNTQLLPVVQRRLVHITCHLGHPGRGAAHAATGAAPTAVATAQAPGAPCVQGVRPPPQWPPPLPLEGACTA
jgi:hypothetical protein